jgi:hypothetical protein
MIDDEQTSLYCILIHSHAHPTSSTFDKNVYRQKTRRWLQANFRKSQVVEPAPKLSVQLPTLHSWRSKNMVITKNCVQTPLLLVSASDPYPLYLCIYAHVSIMKNAHGDSKAVGRVTVSKTSGLNT